MTLEIWGGIECTTNRVRDQYFHQLDFNSCANSIESLDRVAAVGIKTLRYPALWERIAPNGVKHANWTCLDERLGRLKELNIKPILGLVHHGSGPPHTDLTKDCFAEGLAEYAQAVAERYPWIEYYTPINEPLTTARFSGLYGFWYPHGQSPKTFIECLLTQCKAVVLAMQAIKKAQPKAQLIQTDDICKVFSTPGLTYQADLENARRWWSFDLLAGKLYDEHALWLYATKYGVDEAKLSWHVDNYYSPDIMGLNYYFTSSRFLDEEYKYYPEWTWNSNAKQKYADVEALRVRAAGMPTHAYLMEEAWDRYQIPLAITEIHLNSSPADQICWINEAVSSANECLKKGIDVRAITIWALFGLHYWNKLVTSTDGEYECGALDSPELCEYISAIARGETISCEAAWWRTDKRFIYNRRI